MRLEERNAAWWHSLAVIQPEVTVLQGPGYLFPGPSFALGPYEPGPVVFELKSYNPRPPHELFGVGSALVQGSYPSWTVGFEDGYDGDFDDIVISVTATPEASVRVECVPASGARGGTVNCTAVPEPTGASLVVDGWAFLGPGGLSSSGPSGTNPWTGPLVASGTVSVDARVDGSRVTASAPVSVIPRNWSAVTPGFNVREINPGPLPASPNRIGDLGAVGFRPSAAGFATAIVQIAQGPNQGLHYLVGVPFAVEAEVHVNTIALSKGSAFWTGQPVRRGTNAQGQDLCSRADVVPFQSVVRRHEGIGLDPASHARLYRDELFRRAGPSLEDVVAAQAFQVVGLANTRFQAAMAAAQTESAKADQGSNVPTYCLFSGITY